MVGKRGEKLGTRGGAEVEGNLGVTLARDGGGEDGLVGVGSEGRDRTGTRVFGVW